MLKKTLTWDYFTTLSLSLFLNSIASLTFKLPILRKWYNIDIIESEFLSYLWVNNSKIISFYNGRSALYHAFNILNLTKKDEVIISSYTCVSVINSILISWAKIKYVDINKSDFSFDLIDLEKNINKNTKVILLQHTFWKPAQVKKIKEIAVKNNIVLIEDCAHSLWSKVWKDKLWVFWDISIFSTWRDKVISSVNGWFLLINNPIFFKKIKKVKTLLDFPSVVTVIKNHLYNIIWFVSQKTYDFFNIWKIIMFLSRKLKLLPEIITKDEKNCNFFDFNYCLPNSLAFLQQNELIKIKKYRNHRRSLAEYYDETIKNDKVSIPFKKIKSEKNNYFRYPILLKDWFEREKFYKYMKKNNINLWTSWSWSNIVPLWIKEDQTWYIKWTCKNAEDIWSRVLTLPNHFSVNENDISRIVKLINKYK